MSDEKRYANLATPMVQALTSGRFRFETEAQAVSKLEYFKQIFITAKEKDEENQMPENKHCLVLWVRGYAITPEEEKEGFLGNYAFITPEAIESGLYRLACVKLGTELKFHPRRKRPKARLPNWGHPVLRSVKKGRRYPTIKSIQAELDQLHLEYPETTIPANNKLFLMIFDRQADAKNPAQKYVINLVAHPEGGFTFEYELNTYQGRQGPNATAKQDNADAAEEAPQGYFTSMVALKRKNRRPVTGGTNGDGGGDA